VTGIALAAWVYFKSNGITEFVSEVFTNKVIVSDTAEGASVNPEPQFLEKPQFLKKPQFEEKPQVEEVQAPAAEKEVEVVETGSSKLLLEFAMDSWVEVTDASGKRLVYRLAKAQSRRTVEGEAPFKVFLGNAPGVTVNYNGLPFDLGPHRNGDVAQLTIGKAEDNVKQVNQE
jgi:cytoskeleton protein RodZ